jgi:hypothetical protein
MCGYAAEPAARWATSRVGGRPRRGRSACQSMGTSIQMRWLVTSVATTRPPQVTHCRRPAASSRTAGWPGAGCNLTDPVGGQVAASSTPWSRPHSRHVSSARTRTTDRRRSIFGASSTMGAGATEDGPALASGMVIHAATSAVDCTRTRRTPWPFGGKGIAHPEPRSLARRRYRTDRTSWVRSQSLHTSLMAGRRVQVRIETH